ncbi:hypothetical protein [Pendulispora albinea]|uniref:Uncharacterized protein n=1 Tax=Pendulispora albinea TaxID=2741071 RepID=A0ABZ2M443_9BACT
MMHGVSRVLLAASFASWSAAFIAGCGGASSSSQASAPAAAAPSGGRPDPYDKEFLARPPPTKDVEVKNLCPNGVAVYIGDVPNGTTGDHLMLRGGGTSHFPRRPDGTFTIWLEDERGYGLAKVHVKKTMSRVEIGASCRTLSAH